MGPLRCPKCGQLRVRRCHREGPVDHALSVVYVYPFLCLVCGRRFRALRWGRRYTTQPTQGREVERIAVRATPVFWLMTLLLVLATLVLTVFVPSFSRCVWGVSC